MENAGLMEPFSLEKLGNLVLKMKHEKEQTLLYEILYDDITDRWNNRHLKRAYETEVTRADVESARNAYRSTQISYGMARSKVIKYLEQHVEDVYAFLEQYT